MLKCFPITELMLHAFTRVEVSAVGRRGNVQGLGANQIAAFNTEGGLFPKFVQFPNLVRNSGIIFFRNIANF